MTLPYLPHTEAERQEMLAAIGVAGQDDLYEAIPASLRLSELPLPAGLSEWDLRKELAHWLSMNMKGVAPDQITGLRYALDAFVSEVKQVHVADDGCERLLGDGAADSAGRASDECR